MLDDFMAEGVHGDDLGLVAPCGLRREVESWLRVEEVGSEVWVQSSGGDGECTVDRIAAAVCTDRVTLAECVFGARNDDGTALGGRGGAPF